MTRHALRARLGRLRASALLGAACLLIGCTALAPVNVPIDHADLRTGYRIADLLKRDQGPANSPEALVLLAFSGGGTRAAALSYGVLAELRRTSCHPRRAHTRWSGCR